MQHMKRRISAGNSKVPGKKTSLPFRYKNCHFCIKNVPYALDCYLGKPTRAASPDNKQRVSKMASAALTRVSGSVLSVPPARTGVIKNGPRQGETWSIESVNVLVADTNVTAVQLPRRGSDGKLENLNVHAIEKGEIVDFLCEATVYGQDVQLRVLDLFPVDDPAYAPAYSTAS